MMKTILLKLIKTNLPLSMERKRYTQNSSKSGGNKSCDKQQGKLQQNKVKFGIKYQFWNNHEQIGLKRKTLRLQNIIITSDIISDIWKNMRMKSNLEIIKKTE